MSRSRTSNEPPADGDPPAADLRPGGGAPAHRGFLFVVSAPSGTGKTTVVDRLVTRLPDIVRSRSYTSRPPRPGEVDGVDYTFVDTPAFKRLIAADAFLEWADVFGHFYGTHAVEAEQHRAAGLDVVLVIDVQGARQVRARDVDAVTVFVLPPSRAALEARLRQRSRGHEAERDLQQRLRTARDEIEARNEYDYVIVNDEIEACVDRLRGIVVAHRSTAAAMHAAGRAVAATFSATRGPGEGERRWPWSRSG